jgi:anti-anti-sigma factor
MMICNVLPLAFYNRIWKRTASYNKICKIELEQKENVELKLVGSFHHAVMQQFKQNIGDIIEECRGDVVINCGQLTYVDSAFIATLLLFQRYLNKQDRNLMLDKVPARILKILRFSSVIKRFRLI